MAPANGGRDAAATPMIPENIRDLVVKLNDIDQKEMPNPPTREALAVYNGKRAVVLEEIVAEGCLRPAGSVGETTRRQPFRRRRRGEAGRSAHHAIEGDHGLAVQRTEPGARGICGFRFLQTENNVALATNTGPVEPLQDKWRKGLEEFIKAFPTSDEAPEAMLRLAMALEYTREGEKSAKEWYAKLSSQYARFAQAAKGAGAVKRLESIGQTLELSGTNLTTGQPFNVASLKDKVVVVYYWASWSQSLPDDVRKLNSLVKDYGAKGLEIVTVNLDHDAKVAAQTVEAQNSPACTSTLRADSTAARWHRITASWSSRISSSRARTARSLTATPRPRRSRTM